MGGSGKLDDVSVGEFLIEKNGIKLDESAERIILSVAKGTMEERFSPDCYHYHFQSTRDPNCHYNIHEKLQGILA